MPTAPDREPTLADIAQPISDRLRLNWAYTAAIAPAPEVMPDSIAVTVKLFAIYQEAYGVPEVRWQFPPGATVGTVRDRALGDHPHLEPWRDRTRLGLNLQFVEDDTPLQDGDEVVLIPPVSGG